MRAKVPTPARYSQRVDAAVSAGDLRRRFVQVSQRVGTLFARYEQALTWEKVPERCPELLGSMKQEGWAIIKEVALLQGEKLDERGEFDRQFHKQLTAYLNDLAATAAKVRAHIKALKQNEGAS